jgi:dihydrofolate reductase
MVTIIAAMDEDRIIGRGNDLPWHLPEDLEQFRERTRGNTVIMGRKTWESMASGGYASDRPYLDGRVNFVVTRDPAGWAEKFASPESGFHKTFGPHFVDTIELAVARARREFPEFVEEIYLLGGRQLFELALRRNLVHRMVISHVHGKHIGDVEFPPIDPQWQPHPLKSYADFDVVEYLKD